MSDESIGVNRNNCCPRLVAKEDGSFDAERFQAACRSRRTRTCQEEAVITGSSRSLNWSCSFRRQSGVGCPQVDTCGWAPQVGVEDAAVWATTQGSVRHRARLSHSAFIVDNAFGQVSTMPSQSSVMTCSTVSFVP